MFDVIKTLEAVEEKEKLGMWELKNKEACSNV